MLLAEDRVRLQHMLDAVRKARAMIAGRTRSELAEDEQLSLALQRLIEIIGKAAKKVSAEIRPQATSIECAAITGMRDRLIHAYFDVNLDLVWDTMTEDLRPLMAALESLLTAEPRA